MIRTPAQHQTDSEKLPGSITPQHTLNDYIAVKTKPDPRKLTYDEWFNDWWTDYTVNKGFSVFNEKERIYNRMKIAWLASRENL